MVPKKVPAGGLGEDISWESLQRTYHLCPFYETTVFGLGPPNRILQSGYVGRLVFAGKPKLCVGGPRMVKV